MLRLFLLLLLIVPCGSAWAADAPVRLQVRQVDCATVSRPCSATGPDWTWVEIANPEALSTLPPKFELFVDQVRFETQRIEIETSAGPIVIERKGDSLEKQWALGQNLKFDVDTAGADIRSVRIGFEKIDDIGLMRAVRAMTPAAAVAHEQRWSALVALVTGILACSFIYNVFLLTWLKTTFQRWYVLWVASAIAYMLLWTGGIFYVFPELAGPSGIRLGLIAVAMVISTATAFFFELIEPGKLPRTLIQLGRASAAAVFVSGLLAAADQYIDATIGDRALNYAFIAATICIAISLVIAIRRGSRTVWFYLAGWSPPLIVFGLRVARNFGVVTQSDVVDMLTFGAIALEAVVLSLAIADRFRALARERDAADVERETLRRVATTDPLTGLSNRAAFQDWLARLHGDVAADLVVVDVDHLKETNDIAGHDAGDALILAAAARLRAAAGEGARVARIGGDEFGIILAGEQRHLLTGVLSAIAGPGAPIEHLGRQLQLSMSAGHAEWVAGRDTPIGIYKKADLALYRAKAQARGGWCSYADSMHDEVEANRQIIVEARAGIERGEFEMHFQPVVDLASGRIVNHEALLRWHHPSRGMLRPADFAAAFEDARTAALILAKVIGLALDWAAAGGGRVSVNFLGSQLQGEAGAGEILDAVAARGLETGRLIVEVTETVVIGRHDGPIIECLHRLRTAGVAIALDDFGTGYASLIHLRDFPADVLKIDRSFVAGLPGDEGSQKIVRAIVALAHGLGKRVVAEGIETEAQREFLYGLGCDLGQGYLLGEPVPAGHVATSSDRAA